MNIKKTNQFKFISVEKEKQIQVVNYRLFFFVSDNYISKVMNR